MTRSSIRRLSLRPIHFPAPEPQENSLELLRQLRIIDEPVPHTLQRLDPGVPSPFRAFRRVPSVPPLEHWEHTLQLQAVLDVHVEEATRNLFLDRIAGLDHGIRPNGALVVTFQVRDARGKRSLVAWNLPEELVPTAGVNGPNGGPEVVPVGLREAIGFYGALVAVWAAVV